MEESGQLHTRLLFPQGMSPQYPLDGRLGGHQSWVEHCEEEKKSLPIANQTHIPQQFSS
jgi:hypothetical protein